MKSYLVISVIIFIGTVTLSAYADKGRQNSNLVQGKIIFERHCAGCHGTSGKGDGYRILGANPSDFTSPSTRNKSDVSLLETIHEGKLKMPAWKPRLSKEKSRDVLAYIRTLAEQK